MSFRTKPYLAKLSCAWILLTVPVAASTARIYVVNGAGDTVDVIDPETDTVVQQIKGMEGSHGAAFSPDGTRAYISNEYKNLIDVVDPKTGSITKEVAVTGRPNTMVVTRDGTKLFVNIQEVPPFGGIDVIDTTTLEKVRHIPTTGPMHDIYITPDDKYLVSGSNRGDFMVVVDLRTNEPVWEIKYDQEVLTMAVESGKDGSASRIFVQYGGFNGFSIVDFKKQKREPDVHFPEQPSDFLGGFRNPSHGSGIAPDGKTFWIDSGQANAVFVYSLPDIKLIGRVALPELTRPGKPTIGAQPNWMTFTPDGKKLYVSNTWLNSVSAIDTRAMKVVAVIPVGDQPHRIHTLVMP